MFTLNTKISYLIRIFRSTKCKEFEKFKPAKEKRKTPHHPRQIWEVNNQQKILFRLCFWCDTHSYTHTRMQSSSQIENLILFKICKDVNLLLRSQQQKYDGKQCMEA